MEASLRLLRTERIDLMQIHNLLDWRTHLTTLRDWKEAGRLRYLGITHYTSSAYGEVEAALRAERLDFLQINYALDDREAERRILPLAAELDLGVIAMRPLGGGRLVRRLHAVELLKWTLADERVHVAIPATSSAAHARTNTAAGVPPWPSPKQRQTLVSQARR